MSRKISRAAVVLVAPLASSAAAHHTSPLAAACAALISDSNSPTFSALNTTIFNATFFDGPATVDALGVCQATADISVPLCRVEFFVNTSDVSALTAEMWLPADFNGRLLGLGNGGLDGCIDYTNLEYGSSKGFGSVGTNNGHDGQTGAFFANNSEVLLDFTTRSIHLENVVGKQIIEAFYDTPAKRSYYLGCSTGGRQGMYSAFNFPDDFDGILAGSPATNWNNLIGSSGMWTVFFNQTTTNSSFLSLEDWMLVESETLRQCDGIDGVIDGIITEPDACDFRPEEIQCPSGSATNTSGCLTRGQVAGLQRLFSPVFNLQGIRVFPAYNLAADAATEFFTVFNTDLFNFTKDWVKFVVANPDFDIATFGLQTVAQFDALDPNNISTFNGDFTPFMNKGGKIISYHGRADPLIPSDNAKDFYNNAAFNLAFNSTQMDEFYRLFLIPGMGHCFGGVGEVNFGQAGNAVANNSAANNVLDDIVNWVENGVAPVTVVGASADGSTLRSHCRYPQRSVLHGTEFICTTAEDT